MKFACYESVLGREAQKHLHLTVINLVNEFQLPETEGEDLIQDFMMGIWKAMDDYDPESSAKTTWFCRKIRWWAGKMRLKLRRAKRLNSPDLEGVGEPCDDRALSEKQLDLKLDFERFQKSLDPKLRKLLLHYLICLNGAEAGRAVNLSSTGSTRMCHHLRDQARKWVAR